MSETGGLPEVPAAVTLSAPLYNAAVEGLREAVTADLEELLRSLGLPGRPEVQISQAAEGASPFPVALAVHGRKCRYSIDLLKRVASYLTGEPVGPGGTVEKLTNWLAAPDGRPYLPEFVTLTCVEACKARASVLLSPAQAAAYAASLPGFTPPDESWLAAVLAKVLDLRFPLTDLTTVASILAQSAAQARTAGDAAEDLAAALQSGVIEIRLPGEYLRGITTAEPSAGYEQFGLLRDGLFYELGLRYPDFRFVTDEGLRQASVAFRINNVTTLPWAGLRPDELLVNDAPDRLRLLGIEGRAAVSPAGGVACSIASIRDRSALEAARLTVWDALGYVGLCLAQILRGRSGCFVHRGSVETMLEQLSQVFPALVAAARGRYRMEEITGVLRDLAAEGVSVRNLRLILETLLDYDRIPADASGYIVFDDRLVSRSTGAASLTSFVRTGLKSYLSSKYAPARNLQVYILGSEIEKAISGGEGAAAMEDEALLATMRREILIPDASTPPVLLTTTEMRPVVRQMISAEYPWLSVVAIEELLLDLNVEPLGRLTLGR